MFKKGDKVQRAAAFRDGAYWTAGDRVVTVHEVKGYWGITFVEDVGTIKEWDQTKFYLVESETLDSKIERLRKELAALEAEKRDADFTEAAKAAMTNFQERVQDGELASRHTHIAYNKNGYRFVASRDE